MHVLIAVDLFSIVVGNKCAVHASDLELEGVLYKSSPDQVVVLSLEALKIAFHGVDGVILIELPVFNVISNGADSSGFDLKDKRVSILIDVPAIDLRPEQDVVVDRAIPIVTLRFLLHYFGLHDLVDGLPWMCEQILSKGTNLHKHLINLLLTVALICID